MTPRRLYVTNHGAERGQTIVIVAASMVSLIALFALAIDVTTLYTARKEAQRAADAAALAGAKAFVSSGYTSGFVPSPNAQSMATQAALSAGQQSKVGGALLQPAEISVSFPTGTTTNPRITVTITHTDLPLFFSKVFSFFGNTPQPQVSTIASAEAYNPSGGTAPIQTAGVKPWLLPNCHPTTTAVPDCSTPYFVDPTTGSLVNPSAIGKTILLSVQNAASSLAGPPTFTAGATYRFYPLQVPINPPAPACATSPLSSCLGSGPYFDNIACFNPFRFTCGGTGTTTVSLDPAIIPGPAASIQSDTDQGTQCLIHTAMTNPPLTGCTSGQYEQDCFTPGGANNPIFICPGSNNPNRSSSWLNASFISRSDSVVTVPLYDGRSLCNAGVCTGTTIVGFLQLGITRDVGTPAGTIEAIIVNAAGCNPSTTRTVPVSGGDSTPIAVRLVQ